MRNIGRWQGRFKNCCEFERSLNNSGFDVVCIVFSMTALGSYRIAVSAVEHAVSEFGQPASLRSDRVSSRCHIGT
jgi:hypothetical protein